MYQKPIYLDPKDPAADHAIRAMRAAFPSYTGRQFKVRIVDHSFSVRSCWDGGSRDYFAFVELGTLKTSSQVPAQSAFDAPIPGADKVELPPNVGCVEHAIFCGKDMGLTLLIRPDNAAALLPAAPELTENERKCLENTASLKNTYGGETDIRRREAKMSVDEWRETQQELIARGMLRKNGSITPAGRNAIR